MKSKPVELWHAESGCGVPVVLLHGFPLEHSIWGEVTNHLKGYCRVITPDLRGHGHSLRGMNGSSMAGMAADVAALLDKLDISRAILVGHSMGGYVALAFARRYPRRLLGLGLAASKAGVDTVEARRGRYQSSRRLGREGMGWLAPSMAERLTTDAELSERLTKQILRMDPGGAADAQRGMARRRDSESLLAHLNLPVAVIAGEVDVIIPIQGARQMAGLLPNARLFAIPGAGHMPMMEQPGRVADALLWLVKQVK